MYLRITTILYLLAVTWQVGSSQQEMSLPQAISIGLANNYGIKISDKAIQIAELNDTWARAGRTPTVDLTGAFNNNFTDDNNPASFLQGTFYTGGLSANAAVDYVVYAGGRIKVSKQQLELATAVERLEQEAGIQDLMRQIYQQYHEVLFQQEQLEVLGSVFALSRDRLEYEEVRRDYGSSNTYNLLQFENAWLTDSTNVVSQRQRVDIAKRNLYITLDMDGVGRYVFADRLTVVPEEIDAAALAEVMSEDNYTLRSLEMITSLSELNTELARAARRPTVSVGAGVTFQENGFQFYGAEPGMGPPPGLLLSNRLSGSIGANAAWNLYDGGVRRTNIQTAALQEQADRLSVEQARADLLGQLDLLIANYDNQRQILDLADQQIQVSQRNLDISLERFKSGQITSLDYRNIQIQYLNAAFAKVNAIYQLLLTKTDIDWMVGMYRQ